MNLVIEKYTADRLEATVSILADAFATNPLHISAFGPRSIDRNRLFFRIGLQEMFTRHAFIALVDGQVQGYLHFADSPDCLPPPEHIPAAVATLLGPLADVLPPVIQWFSMWCRLDPEEPHIHLGPVGVAPGAQGKGVGKALMDRYIDYLRRNRAAGYLETDRPENVEFYKKFGFIVQREADLIGVRTWYMWRRPEPVAKSHRTEAE